MRTSLIAFRLINIAVFFILFSNTTAQNQKVQVHIDKNGVMRWSADKEEIYGFGVNYTLPFAHEYRMTLLNGVSPEEAIRQDVYHMARLDLDFYRVHVWDTEISDTLGNILENEHLRLFDFLLSEMKSRGMHFIVTPIAYWGNGWPEKDGDTPGFSRKYGKEACLTNPDAIRAQANYLNQFASHVNSYTGLAYKDDPDIIAFEISNEPHHDGSPESVTAFINTMVSAIRKTGCQKPVFYNMSHSIHLADAYLNSGVQGGTFQWYPTGLVANHQINGNFTAHVSSYQIPFADNPKFRGMARIIYEFDAADAGGNYMYPLMAQTFRKAGMQMAAHFAYDAMCNAPWNTNYGTHFMNLAYTPRKAISLKIASAVFHNQPMYTSSAASLHVSYPDDLAEWNDKGKFFYSNSTVAMPADLTALKEIAGCGSSPVVTYSGSGAYFLDKLANGVWRLEVMPDAYWIKDPYSPVTPKIQKAAVVHSVQNMNIDLPDLGRDFTVEAINKGNTFKPIVTSGKFEVKPGTYLLKSSGSKNTLVSAKYRNISIDEYIAPETNLTETVVWNSVPVEATAGKPVNMSFTVAALSRVKKAQIYFWSDRLWKTFNCTESENGSFNTELPADLAQPGFYNYRIIVETENDTVTFPGSIKGSPFDWTNNHAGYYKLRIVQSASPLVIWESGEDWEYTYKVWNRNIGLVPAFSGGAALKIDLKKLPAINPSDTTDRNYAFKFFFRDKISGRVEELKQKRSVAIQIVNKSEYDQPVEVAIIDENTAVVSAKLNVSHGDTIYRLPLESFRSSDYLVIPRPFPDFLPYRVSPAEHVFNLSLAETLQVSVLPTSKGGAGLLIEKIWLE